MFVKKIIVKKYMVSNICSIKSDLNGWGKV